MLRVTSLFCGCGGMDKGILGGFDYLGHYYAKLPFEIVYAADNDPYAIKIYNDNFTHHAELKDVRDIVAHELPDHDILLGAFRVNRFLLWRKIRRVWVIKMKKVSYSLKWLKF